MPRYSKGFGSGDDALEYGPAGRVNHRLGQCLWRWSNAVAPGICRVRALIIVALLFGGTDLAVAQDAPLAKASQANPAPPPPRPTPSHAARLQRVALPSAIPEQFSPPQEAYASFPEAVGAGATSTPGKPSACQLRLAKLAVFRPLPLLAGAGECGAVDAVLLDAVILPDRAKVTVTPPATLRCPMAEAVANWVREDVAPAALKLGAPLRGLDNFDSYECRGRNRVRGATLSEHGRANALDVRALNLADGEAIGLTDVNVAKAWRESLRASACARFSTVLGPGSDGHHEEHVHMDLAERRGGYKTCEWDVREPAKVAETIGSQAETAAALPEPVPLPRPRPMAANTTDDSRSRKARLQPRPQL